MIIKTNQDEIATYLKDASNFQGRAKILFIPENSFELREAIVLCNSKKTPVTIYGAGTGLTGAVCPLGGAIISMERMKKIKIDKKQKYAICEPGVTLNELQQELAAYGLFYPPNPTETNSSIGGNAATNASGSRTLKYGATRDFIISAEIILINGDKLKLERGIDKANGIELELIADSGISYSFSIPDIFIPDLKHNAGYFLKSDMDAIDLFIGSEGTLGVFSEIVLRLTDLPESVFSGLVFFENDKEMLDFVEKTKKNIINNKKLDYKDNSDFCPRLLEYFDGRSLIYLRNSSKEMPEKANSAIWFEQEYTSSNENVILESFSQLVYEHTLLADKTIMANDNKSIEKLRTLRHELPLAVNERLVRENLRKFGTDTAVTDENFREYFFCVKDLIAETGLDYYIFGHIGNNHIHSNLFAKSENDKLIAQEYYNKCIKKALELGGTVSAEHGIGKIKKEFLLQMYGKEIIEKMKEIKSVFDPDFLLGRGNLF